MICISLGIWHHAAVSWDKHTYQMVVSPGKSFAITLQGIFQLIQRFEMAVSVFLYNLVAESKGSF